MGTSLTATINCLSLDPDKYVLLLLSTRVEVEVRLISCHYGQHGPTATVAMAATFYTDTVATAAFATDYFCCYPNRIRL